MTKIPDDGWLDHVAAERRLKDHEIAKVVNDVTDVARTFHNTQQLRERIRDAMEPLIAASRVNWSVANGQR